MYKHAEDHHKYWHSERTFQRRIQECLGAELIEKCLPEDANFPHYRLTTEHESEIISAYNYEHKRSDFEKKQEIEAAKKHYEELLEKFNKEKDEG